MDIYEGLEKDKRREKKKKNDYKKAIRKRRLTKELYSSNSDCNWDYYNNLHQYSKNKIHCSCGMCRAKTNDKKHKLYSTTHRKNKNWTHSDRKKIEKMKADLSEY